MQALRSGVFSLLMVVSAILYAPLTLLVAPFPAFTRYRFISRWARFILAALRVICRLDYSVHGQKNLPKGTAIVLCKHQSAWETIALQQILPPQVWVLKRELLWIPFFGWALALLRPIAIDRHAGRQAIHMVLTQGKDRLDQGFWVIIFPEGTRVPPGTRKRYGTSGALLAERSGYPVVPIAHNAGEYWPRRAFHKRAGTIQVVIGPTIQPAGRSAAEIIRLAENWIEGTMEQVSQAIPAQSINASHISSKNTPTRER